MSWISRSDCGRCVGVRGLRVDDGCFDSTVVACDWCRLHCGLCWVSWVFWLFLVTLYLVSAVVNFFVFVGESYWVVVGRLGCF